MLSAVIVNLQLLGDRAKRAMGRTIEPSDAEPLEMNLVGASNLQAWLEPQGDGAIRLQLFCPSWTVDRACRIDLRPFGKATSMRVAAGSTTRDIASEIALTLDRWFDVTLPATPHDSQRRCVELRTKTRAGTTTSSTDGMVVLSSDGRGLSVEVGLDDPSAAGGVITVAVAGRTTRFTTSRGQHGGEVVRRLAKALQSLGCTVVQRSENVEGTLRARLDIVDVMEEQIPQLLASA